YCSLLFDSTRSHGTYSPPLHDALPIYLPDNVGFYDHLTGRENLRYTARLNGIADAEAERRIDDLLDQVGLTEAADRRVGGYSRRSEEHTSELQSREKVVCRLLLGKK